MEGSAAGRQPGASIPDAMRSAAGVAGDSSVAMNEAASALAARGQDSLSQAATVLADKLASLAGYLENRNLNEITREARQIAHDNPALFIAGGVAAGMLLGRFFKASTGGQDSAESVRRADDSAKRPADQFGPAGPGQFRRSPDSASHYRAFDPGDQGDLS